MNMLGEIKIAFAEEIRSFSCLLRNYRQFPFYPRRDLPSSSFSLSKRLPYYTDGSYKSSSQEASDVLSEILKNLPHKPMKSVGHNQYSGGHSFNQLPIPDDPQPPPFKPLNEYSPYDTSFDSPQSIQSHYGPPNHFSDFSAQGSASRPIAVNPKAYDIYHSMKIKLKKEKNFVTLPTIIDGKGLEIQKSIGFELTA